MKQLITYCIVCEVSSEKNPAFIALNYGKKFQSE